MNKKLTAITLINIATLLIRFLLFYFFVFLFVFETGSPCMYFQHAWNFHSVD